MKHLKSKKLLQCVCFLALLWLIFFALAKIFDPLRLHMTDYVAEKDKYFMQLMEEPENTVDVIIMGDSLSYGVISPLEFWEQAGVTSAIAGEVGQVVPATYFELKQILLHQQPKVLILEANILILDFATALDATQHQVLNYALPITKYHELWKPMLGFTDNKNEESFHGLEIRTAVNAYTGGEYMVYTDDVAKLTGLSKYYLKKIKKLCDENGVELLLVASPSPSNYNYANHNGLSSVAEEYGIPFVNMNLINDELGIDWSIDTLDGGDHLNYTGVKKTSTWLLNYLLANYELKDRRGDAIAEDWNTAAAEFRAKKGLSQN